MGNKAEATFRMIWNPEGTDNLKSRDDNQVEVKETTVRLRKVAWI